MKYTNEILNTALSDLQNMDIKERKKAATTFMKAACAELGTVNTKPVKEWFVLNIENYLTAIKDETDSEIIWRNLYTLQQFCARYIHSAYLFKINSDIITEDNVKMWKKKLKHMFHPCLKYTRILRYYKELLHFSGYIESPLSGIFLQKS
jgi:conserved domain protein